MQDIFSQNGVKITQKQAQQFEHLYTLFNDWNSRINLSAIRDREGIYLKHFLDSVLVHQFIDFSGAKNLLDLGAGGGFPCLPLAILYPEIEIHALDSVGKKMKAVQDMADQLNLNLKTHHGRIEEFGQDQKFREQFDIVTARALAPWSTLLEYTLPFTKVGGQFIAYQGPAILEELGVEPVNEDLSRTNVKKIPNLLGGKLKNIYTGTLPSTSKESEESARHFLQVIKTNPTPNNYPRPIGIPKKNPLQ